ncbi:MAG: GMC family oxidoreductase [Flavobacteriales bacterium]|nr:GMC family oxidoreductase [Flavobacteriales bacterium]
MSEQTTFDAIVIGSGISGGWAAKELCESGLKTLVLERGRMVEHVKDYPTAMMDPWDFEHGGYISEEEKATQLVQRRTGQARDVAAKHFFVNDIDHPYNEDKKFNWMRGYHVGGRSLTWGRQTYRWSDIDFEANKNDGHGVDWPIRYKDIDPWYSLVEKYIGVQGSKEDLPQLPDGEFTEPFPMNCVEEHCKEKLEEAYPDRNLINCRSAHVTGENAPEGRSQCQLRSRCRRGCPYGGYFSSNSSTLPAAEKTGNFTLRMFSIVHSIIYDDETGMAKGVKVIDQETKEELTFYSKVIFCNASTVGSTAILLNSKSERFPNGMGNDSGELGHNMMDHTILGGANTRIDGFEDKYTRGKKPGHLYLPKFKNIGGSEKGKNFVRGYGYQGGASRRAVPREYASNAIGGEYKDGMMKFGDWRFGITCFGEILPDHRNKMYLDYDKKDGWGLPTVTFDCELRENEINMANDGREEARKMCNAITGRDDAKTSDNTNKYAFGHGIHEMGTARMGRDPKTSVLNGNNQIHAVPNVYVTDGACMTSAACVNPSITYMALTARAASHAISELKKGTFS